MSRSTGNPTLSPIAEHPEGIEEAHDQQLNQSMANLSLNNQSASSSSSVSSTFSPSAGNSSNSSSSQSNSGRRQRVRRSETTTPEQLSPTSGPGEAQGKTTRQKRRRRRRPQQYKLKDIEKVNFNRYIHSVFRSTFSFYHRPPRQSASASPAERVKVSPIRPPSSISNTAMSVLNTLVKDLIGRFAGETNKLLDNSPLVTLDAPEAISAIRMMLGRNDIEFAVIIERFGMLSANMPSRRRVRKEKQPRAKQAQ